MTLTGGPATLTAAADGTITIAGETRATADITGIVITGSDADDSLTLDLHAPLTIPVSFDGGAGNDTIVGPVSDVTWDVTGPDAGTVAGVHFTSVENLSGAPDNKDTFVVGPEWFRQRQGRRRSGWLRHPPALGHHRRLEPDRRPFRQHHAGRA